VSYLHRLSLALILLSALTAAKAQEAAPRFTINALDGETFTNSSLRGRLALIQFWTTWCPYCRGDEPSLESINRAYSGRGLVIIGLDAGESGETVKKYLGQHPRAGHIALTQNTDLVAQFAPDGLPYYVLIDRDGSIAGVQSGGGGEPALRDLLSRAGLGASPFNSRGSSEREAPPRAVYPASPKMIEAPRGRGGPPVKAVPPTVFILKSGERIESRSYTIQDGSLRITLPKDQRTVPIAELNIKATIASNHARGIELKIPTNPNEIFLGF
jgi:cytochrome c biogenesis protein CcmG/thiol:disulfide interchange protein DsbE